MKKEYYKITVDQMNGWQIVEKKEIHNTLDGLMDGAPHGTRVNVENVLMEEKEFEELPEFVFE